MHLVISPLGSVWNVPLQHCVLHSRVPDRGAHSATILGRLSDCAAAVLFACAAQLGTSATNTTISPDRPRVEDAVKWALVLVARFYLAQFGAMLLLAGASTELCLLHGSRACEYGGQYYTKGRMFPTDAGSSCLGRSQLGRRAGCSRARGARHGPLHRISKAHHSRGLHMLYRHTTPR